MADQPVAQDAPQQPAPGGQDQGAAGGQIQDLVNNTLDALSMNADVFGSLPGLDPKLQEGFKSLAETYKGLVQAAVSGGQGGAPAGPQGSQPASMEAGANPNARPMGPQGAM